MVQIVHFLSSRILITKFNPNPMLRLIEKNLNPNQAEQKRTMIIHPTPCPWHIFLLVLYPLKQAFSSAAKFLYATTALKSMSSHSIPYI